MAEVEIDLEIVEDLLESDNADKLKFTANATSASDALAIGMDNSNFGETIRGFRYDLAGGNDTLRAVVDAVSQSESGVTLATGVLTNQGGVMVLGDGDDRISAETTAEGAGDNQVEAYGILTTNMQGGEGQDRLTAEATSKGGNIATASGIRIGTFEDNTVAVTGGEPFGNEAGIMDLGEGSARVEGRAISETASDGAGTFFNDINGILVDVASIMSTGSAADTIKGRAFATDTGTGGGNILTLNAMSADGVELRGDMFVGGGADIIRGNARGEATNSFTVVEGIDIGLGNNLNAALGGNPNLINVDPTLGLGSGSDQISGNAFSSVAGQQAGTVSAGIQSVGTINAGTGDDDLRGSAHSVVSGGQNGIRGAIADGVQNFVINDALRVDQSGTINLGAGNNRIDGRAIAEGRDFIAFATGISGGTVTAQGGNDVLKGRASAFGLDEVGATGVLLIDANLGAGQNLIRGRATAEGGASTDARGISVGLSDIDDDSLQNPEDSSAVQAGQLGQLLLGNGNDTLSGSADVSVNAADGDEIFFAGGNGIVNDGGLIDDLQGLLANIGKDLSNFDASDIEAVIGQLGTSTLDTGAGNDRLITEVTLNVAQDGQGADDDLEVIGDGIENAGRITLGNGNDAVRANVSVTSTIAGAKALADALDNSSVGIISGLDLEVNRETVFDLGNGHDRFVSKIFATAIDDLSAADGLGNRGTFLAGAGNDFFDLKAEARFVLASENDAEQQEGIADGWENRADVFLGAGNDRVKTDAKAFGEGILTIAEGLESRELFDTGSGNDRLMLSAEATTAAVSSTGATALSDNLTQAAGLQTEQFDEGEFLMRGGNDAVIATAVATSDVQAGQDNAGTVFSPTTFAFGITQMTADASKTDPAAGTGVISTGSGEDVLDGTATATGITDVAAFGILIENTLTGIDNDKLNGSATATSGDVALATGIGIGLAEDVFVKENSTGGKFGLGAEAGTLDTGNGADTLTSSAVANGVSQSVARGIDGANGSVTLGRGADEVTAEATATVNDANGTAEAIGIFGGILDTGAGNDTVSARSNDLLVGTDGTTLAGGQGFGGSAQIKLGNGDDVALGFGEANVDGGEGIDKLKFEFALNDFVRGGGVLSDGAFSFDGVTLQSSNFEQFEFGADFFDDTSTDTQVFEGLAAVQEAIDTLLV